MKLFCLIILSCLLLSCTSKKDERTEILLAEFGAMSGPQASFGKHTHQGVQMAVDEINKNNKRFKVKILVADNGGSEEKTPQVLESLLQEAKPLALIGEISSDRSLAAAPIAQKYKVPMVSPSSTNPKVTEVGDYIFRTCFIDTFQGKVMADFAYNNLKIKKLAVMRERDSSYSTGLADAFVKTLKELGGEVVSDQHYESGDINFKKQLEAIRSQKPEGIFIPGYYTEVAHIARQARQLGIKSHLLGGDGWDNPKLFEIGREAVNGGFYSNFYTFESTDPTSRKFVNKFREIYGQDPDALAAMSYDTVYIIMTAIESIPKGQKITHEALRDALTNIKDFKGVTGNTTIDDKRNGVKPAVVLRVDGPSSRYYTTIQP